MVRGGADKVSAGGGDDGIEFDNTLTSADHINGGAGNDYLELSGDYSAGLKFGATTMINVETLLFNPGHFKLIMDDGNVAAGQQLSINTTALGATDSVYIDASRETDGTYDFHGSVGVDTFIGGQAGNKFFGGLGSDRMTAGAGIDTFTVTDVGESTGLGRDVITGFDALQDRFDFNGIVTGIDSAVTTGVLRNGHFDSDLAHYIDSAHLGAQHVVLYTPDSGDWAGHTFLVVDVNGTAGYQAGQDMVFQLESGAHLANLSTSDFI